MYVCICHSQLSRSVDVVTSAASSPPPWRGRQHYELRVLEPNPRSHNASSWQRRESIAWQTHGCRRFSPPPGNGSIKHAHSYNNKMFKVAVIGVPNTCTMHENSYRFPIQRISSILTETLRFLLLSSNFIYNWSTHWSHQTWFSPGKRKYNQIRVVDSWTNTTVQSMAAAFRTNCLV